MSPLNEEVSWKLGAIRNALVETGAAAVRLRRSDWFVWATAGASPTVLPTAATGVAEVLVTAEVEVAGRRRPATLEL